MEKEEKAFVCLLLIYTCVIFVLGVFSYDLMTSPNIAFMVSTLSIIGMFGCIGGLLLYVLAEIYLERSIELEE